MKGLAIGPIVSHNVRGFLLSQGVALHPGMTLDEALSALFVAFTERKDDEGFWESLAQMMDAVLACAGRSKPGSAGAADRVSIKRFV